MPTTGEPIGAPDPSSSHDRPYSRPWCRFTLEHAIGRSEGVELTTHVRTARRRTWRGGWRSRDVVRAAGLYWRCTWRQAALARLRAVPGHLLGVLFNRHLGRGGPAERFRIPRRGRRSSYWTFAALLAFAPGRPDHPLQGTESAEAPEGRSGGVGMNKRRADSSASFSAAAKRSPRCRRQRHRRNGAAPPSDTADPRIRTPRSRRRRTRRPRVRRRCTTGSSSS
jgi:hypothetical protein